MYILVSCSRRTGANSYEEVGHTHTFCSQSHVIAYNVAHASQQVAKKAFGTGVQVIAMTLLSTLIYLGIVGYVKLTNDLFTPILERLLVVNLSYADPITGKYETTSESWIYTVKYRFSFLLPWVSDYDIF